MDAWLWEFTVRATLLLALGWLSSRLFRRRNAALRHAVWAGSFIGVIALGVGNIVLPQWQVLPAPMTRPVIVPSLVSGEELAIATALMSASAPPVPERVGSVGRVSWPAAAMVVWLVGVAVMFARIMVGLAVLRRFSVAAENANEALVTRGTLLAHRLGVRRRVRWCVSSRGATPLTWGFRQPIIMMPAIAATWPMGRQDRALIHELAHVGRGDAVVNGLARVVRAVLWFHPLAWLGVRQLDATSEAACDDAVLALGGRPSDYADDLLRTAADTTPTFARAMSRDGSLAHRIESLLDPNRPSAIIMDTVGSSWLRRGMVCAAVPLAVASARTVAPITTEGHVAAGIEAALPQAAPPSLQQSPRPRRSSTEEWLTASLTEIKDPEYEFDSRRRATMLIALLPEWRESDLLREEFFCLLEGMPAGRDRSRVLREVLRLPAGSATVRQALVSIRDLPDSRMRRTLLTQAAQRGDLSAEDTALDDLAAGLTRS